MCQVGGYNHKLQMYHIHLDIFPQPAANKHHMASTVFTPVSNCVSCQQYVRLLRNLLTVGHYITTGWGLFIDAKAAMFGIVVHKYLL